MAHIQLKLSHAKKKNWTELLATIYDKTKPPNDIKVKLTE